MSAHGLGEIAATGFPGMTELPPLPSSSSLSVPAAAAAATDAAPSSTSSTPLVLFGKYTLLRKLGSGSFGDIYLGLNTLTSTHVAVKLEAQDMRWKQLCFESRLYSYLQGKPGHSHTHMHRVSTLHTTLAASEPELAAKRTHAPTTA